MSGYPARATTAADPVYLAQLAGLPPSPGCPVGLPLLLVRLAPPMMLLIARAATCRLSIGLSGLYGWCRFSDHATSPPCVAEIGSSPWRPVLASLKFGLSPLVISENTHRIWLVSFPQAKLTWFGSETMFGFWQAVLISLCTTATLAGHDALGWNTTTISAVRPIANTASPIAILPVRPKRPRRTLRRPRSINALVRSSSARVRPATRGSFWLAARRAAVWIGAPGPACGAPAGRPAARPGR